MLLHPPTAAMLLAFVDLGIGATSPPPSQIDPVLVRIAEPAPPLGATDGITPEQKMWRRYPQPVQVANLIGLPLLDDTDRILGRVHSVVRTASGQIQLIVPHAGFLRWRQRLVAVPIEVVGIAGRQLAILDISRADFEAAPAWNDPLSQPIPASDVIRIALYKR